MLSEDTRRIELIESHLQNTLTAVEQIEFNQLLATDPSFGEELKDIQAITGGLNGLALEKFQSQLASFEQSARNENKKTVQLFSANTAPKSNIFSIKRIAAAAAVIALLIAGPLTFFYNSGNSHEELFAKYNSDDKVRMSLTVRGTNDAADTHIRRDYPNWTSFNQGVDAFAKKDFNSAETSFLDALTNCPADVKRADAQVFLGMTYMSQGHTAKALDTFTGVVSETSMKMELDWNKALCMVRLSKISEAKEILKTISTDSNHEYQRTAANLLGEL